jgi:hypothetical protein
VVIVDHGERLCARPIATPPGVEKIAPGPEPAWEAYMPDNSAAPDTFVFKSKVRTGKPCQGPS